jgi:hypothetical protein
LLGFSGLPDGIEALSIKEPTPVTTTDSLLPGNRNRIAGSDDAPMVLEGWFRLAVWQINPKTEVGRDGALCCHRAVQARNRSRVIWEFCTVRSAR